MNSRDDAEQLYRDNEKLVHGALLSLVQYIGDIGKTVFLTREEAEKALEVMK